MTIIETRQLQRPSLSQISLERARAEYQCLDAEQQAALRALGNSDYRMRGALLAYLHLVEQAMEKSSWTKRQIGEALDISEQAVSLWFKTGEIDARHITRIMSHEMLGVDEAPSACDCDVHSYRAAIGWVRRTIFRVKATPKHVPAWKEFVLISALHSLDIGPGDAIADDLPQALQPYFRGWDRRSTTKGGSRITKALDKWGAAYRLFVLEEYHRGKVQ